MGTCHSEGLFFPIGQGSSAPSVGCAICWLLPLSVALLLALKCARSCPGLVPVRHRHLNLCPEVRLGQSISSPCFTGCYARQQCPFEQAFCRRFFPSIGRNLVCYARQ